jgi:hypothetical protein
MMAMSDTVDVETLRSYLAETLPAEESARVEKALRQSSELRALLEDVRQNRDDVGAHSLGAIWRRGRLTCPTRQQLGSFLLDALDPQWAGYITFHLDVVGCPFCKANLADLRGKASQAVVTKARHQRIFESSRHLLSEGGS